MLPGQSKPFASIPTLTNLIAQRSELDSGFTLGSWLVEPNRNALSRGGEEKHIENRLMQTLVFLARHPGQVISREQFFDSVWQGLVVNEEALTRAISLLRAALGDSIQKPTFIQTIPGCGYRLITEPQLIQRQTPAAPAANEPGEPVTGDTKELLDRAKFGEQTYRSKLVMALSSTTLLSAQQRNATRARQAVDASRHKKHVKIFIFALIAMFIAWMGTYFYMDSRNPDATSGQSEQTARIKKYGVPSIAIMPMEILTRDADLNYIAKASGDDLLLRLQFASFRTVTIRDTPPDLNAKDIGQQYDVDYVWYQTIARNDNEYRIVKRLVETASGVDIVSYQHTITSNELFEVQNQMAGFSHEFTIAVLAGESKRLRDVPVEGMNAWELIHKPVDTYPEARANVERAYELDPNNYGANSVLAGYLRSDVLFQKATDVVGGKAKALRLSRRGYELAPHDEFAIQTVCAVELSFGDPALALGYARKLGVLNSFTASEYYEVLIGNGLAEEALIHATKNPLIGSKTLGDIYLHLDRFAEAEDAYRKQLADTPDDFMVWIYLANVLGQEGKLEAGREIIERVNKNLTAAGQSRLTIAIWETGVRLAWGDLAYPKFVDGLKQLGIG